VNCAAIPESLIESELFGYSAGAFTGGRAKGAKGLIQQADGGTLFLDEIGDMPLALQTRLLRVLADQQVTPLGADRPVAVDCRVIAATHQNLPQLIESGRFRQDLYYRLNGATLMLPPLRERADLEFLIRTLLNQLKQGIDRPALRLRADAISAMLAWRWPGNVRELVNVLAYAEANARSDVITVDDLPDDVCMPLTVAQASETGQGADSSIKTDMVKLSLSGTGSGTEPVAEVRWLVQLLEQEQWNLSSVARLIGVSRPTLYRRIRKFGIHRQTCIN